VSESAAIVAGDDQLELVPEPRCKSCGRLSWTIERFGRILHKCGCEFRTDDYCQAHPQGCDTFTDIRTRAYQLTHHRACSQLTELPGETWEDLFNDEAA
jgi:hypothetical protein